MEAQDHTKKCRGERLDVFVVVWALVLAANAFLAIFDRNLLLQAYLWITHPDHAGFLLKAVEALAEFCDCPIGVEA